ncbi:hypothetical protein SprV_0902664400 [Sparganum proliferum]
MSLRLSLWGSQFATIISAYAPPKTSSGKVNTNLYGDLYAVLAYVPRAEKLVVLDQHLPSADAEEGRLDAPPPMEALAAAGQYSRPAARSAGRAGECSDLRRRWVDGTPPRRLRDEVLSAGPQEVTR